MSPEVVSIHQINRRSYNFHILLESLHYTVLSKPVEVVAIMRYFNASTRRNANIDLCTRHINGDTGQTDFFFRMAAVF